MGGVAPDLRSQELPNECRSAHAVPMLRVLRPARAVKLADSDSAPIASLTALAVSSRGFVALLDAQDYNIKLFNSEGRLHRVIGRRGGGPGEFVRPSAITMIGDSLIVVADDGRGRLIEFDTAGGVRAEHPLQARAFGSLLHAGGALFVGAISGLRGGQESPRLALRLPLPLPSEAGGLVALPDSYSQNPYSLSSQVYVARAPEGPGVLVTWRFSNEILHVLPDGHVARSAGLPNHETFVDSRVVARTVPREAILAATSPILGIFSSAGRIYVSYLPPARPGSKSRPLRYHVLDKSFRSIGSDVSGPGILAVVGDSVIAVGNMNQTKGEASTGYHLSWMVRCR